MVWPTVWPDRRLLDLGDIGDPGAFIQQNMQDDEITIQGIIGSSRDGEIAADSLLDSFIHWPGSQDALEAYRCENSKNDHDHLPALEEDLRTDFRAFIREWRERIVTTIERQAKP